MTIYRRRLASSFNALKCTLIKRLQRVEPLADDEDASQDETRDDIMSGEEAAALARSALVAEETVEIKALLKAIEKAGTETKAKRLADEIEKLLENDYDSVIVFTQYTDTMDSLAEFLASRLPDLPIGTYSGKGGRTRDKGGTWTNCSKEHIKGALKAKRVRLLVATDAAGEGLNLQFCGVIVNYDLPWNPMKVEQRIGRIDRIGQVHKEVHVVSLAYKDTIEADVYLALGERINLFQGIVGKLQPILSRLPQEFERVVLERSENREATRQRFIADIENQVTQAELSPFDIDEVSADALEMPMLPDPPFTPEVLAEAMTLPGVKPSGWEWRRLDPGSCGLRVPGQDEIRVATTAEVFDAHPESMAFFTPGMPAFDDIIGDAEATQDVEPEPGTLPLVTVREDDGGEVFELNLPAFTGEVSNLGFLIEVLKGTGTAK
ncbi:MAG: helicase-related protein [Candidatus Sumerlaeota bacterium]|nr:helicase-related protein [Candidatus Sumerlaeota bacterium]